MLTDDPSEMGARIGFGFAFHGLGSLIGAHFKATRQRWGYIENATGTPITGALLTSEDHWWRAIIYGAVGHQLRRVNLMSTD